MKLPINGVPQSLEERSILTLASRAPRIVLPLKVLQQLSAYIAYCDTEISGIGEVEIVDNDIFVPALHLLPQRCTGVHTEIDQPALHRFMMEWVAAEKDLGRLRCWWHSHVDMSAYWSSIDEGHINQYRRNEWWLSIVGNRQGHIRARLDVFKPVRVTLDCLPVVMESPLSSRALAGIVRDISTQVRSNGQVAPTRKSVGAHA